MHFWTTAAVSDSVRLNFLLVFSCAGLETASSQLRVSIPLVAEVIAEVYGARMVGGAQDTFPLQQKMAVCTLLMLVRGKTLKEVELGKVRVGLPRWEIKGNSSRPLV